MVHGIIDGTMQLYYFCFCGKKDDSLDM